MFDGVPSEVQLLDVFVPPLFLAIVGGLLSALIVARLLNITGLSRFFWHPPLALAALWVLLSGLISLIIIQP